MSLGGPNRRYAVTFHVLHGRMAVSVYASSLRVDKQALQVCFAISTYQQIIQNLAKLEIRFLGIFQMTNY